MRLRCCERNLSIPGEVTAALNFDPVVTKRRSCNTATQTKRDREGPIIEQKKRITGLDIELKERALRWGLRELINATNNSISTAKNERKQSEG